MLYRSDENAHQKYPQKKQHIVEQIRKSNSFLSFASVVESNYYRFKGIMR